MESPTRSKCPNKGEKKRTTSSPTKHFEELKKGTRSHSSTDRWLATEAKSSEQGWFARRQPDLQLQASEQGVEAPPHLPEPSCGAAFCAAVGVET